MNRRRLLFSIATIALVGPRSGSAQQQTSYTQSGIILTRPSCSPGNSVPANYVKGPSPVLRNNGDVDILMNTGNLGNPLVGIPNIGTWECLWALHYPAAGSAALWYPIR